MKLMKRFGNCLSRVSRGTVVGIVLWVVIVGLYTATAARTMTGFGDSDELITAGYTASLSHPPGYPLLTGLIFVAAHIPAIAPAVGAHLLAGLLMATTMWFVYHIILDVAVAKKERTNWWHLIVIGLFTVIVATTGLLWEHGTHIEVFGLNALLSLWFLRLTFKKPGLWWALVGGLGFAHHQTFVLIWIPVVIWQVTSKQISWRRWLGLLGLMAIGFSTGYGLLMVLGTHTTDYSWKFTLTLSNIWRFYSRADYGGYSPELGQLSAWWSGISIHTTIEAWGFYLGELWRHWSVFGMLGLVGLILGKKSLKRVYWLLLGGFLMSGPLLAGYLGVLDGIPGSIDYETSRAIVERMYVLGEVWWALWVVLGGYLLIASVGERWRRIVTMSVAIITVLWIGVRLPAHNLAAYIAAEYYAREVMGNLPVNARLICLSDVSCFGTTFIQAVLGIRKDVVVVSSAAQYRSEYISRQTNLSRFTYPDNPYRIGEMVGWSTYSGIPTVVTQLSAYWANELGLNGEAFRLTPLPYSLAIVRDAVGVVPAYKPVYAATQQLITSPLEYRYVRVLKAVLTEHHALAANLFRRMDNRDYAKSELTAGLLLQPTNQILLSMKQTIDTDPPDPTYRDVLTNVGYEVRINDCRKQQDTICALWQSRWLTFRNPDQVFARLELARSLETARQLPFAKREYRHVIELDAKNQEALTALKRLDSVIDLGNTLF